jgi:hypothetical protein
MDKQGRTRKTYSKEFKRRARYIAILTVANAECSHAIAAFHTVALLMKTLSQRHEDLLSGPCGKSAYGNSARCPA